MNGQAAAMNWFVQKSKNAGDFLADSILGVVYMLVVFIALWICKIFQGIYFLVLGAIAFYFIAGGIGLLCCFVFGMLGHLYLGH